MALGARCVVSTSLVGRAMLTTQTTGGRMASKNTPGWQSFKADYLRENASSFPEAEPPKAAVTWL